MTGFLRRTWNRYSKLGKGRRKKQKWRKPKGRDNKMREKRKGYPSVVSIGYKKNTKERKNIKVISNINDLENVSGVDYVIIGKIGKKKKIEIIKKAIEKRVNVQNVNIKKFLKEIGKLENKKEIINLKK